MSAKDIRWDHVTKSNKINDQIKDLQTVDDLTTDNVDLKATVDETDYHLDSLKTVIDYIKHDKNYTEKHDGMIHDLIKVIRLVKGLKKEQVKAYNEFLDLKEKYDNLTNHNRL